MVNFDTDNGDNLIASLNINNEYINQLNTNY